MPVYRRNDRYPMVRIESAQDWRSLLEVCDGHLDEDRLSQLQGVLGPSCKTVVVERDCDFPKLWLLRAFDTVGEFDGLVTNDQTGAPRAIGSSPSAGPAPPQRPLLPSTRTTAPLALRRSCPRREARREEEETRRSRR